MDQEGLAAAETVGRLLSPLCEVDFVGMQNASNTGNRGFHPDFKGGQAVRGMVRIPAGSPRDCRNEAIKLKLKMPG